MAFNWHADTGDAMVAKVFSDVFYLDAVENSVWNDLTYSLDSDDISQVNGTGSLTGVVHRIKDFEGGKKKGDTITWDNSAALGGGPVLGDSPVAGTAQPINLYSQSASIDQARKSVKSNGRLSEQRLVPPFRKTARRLLSQWANVYWDETCNIVLAGESTFNNAYTCYTSGTFSAVLNTSLNSTDSGNIIYAGNATTNATAAQAANAFSAQLLTKVVIQAQQGATTANYIPVKPLQLKDSKSQYALLCDQNINLQLAYDSDWRLAQQQGNIRSGANPTISGSLGSYANVEIIPQNRAFRPIANVSYAMFLGADALNFMPVYDWEWIEETEDVGFIGVIVVAMMAGITNTYFNGTKRNMKQIPHYVAF